MPDWKPEIRARLTGLNFEPAREAGVVEEISQHLDDRFAELRARGVSEEEARRAALEELSSKDILARELRRVERSPNHDAMVIGQTKGNIVEEFFADLKYGARMLRKNPGFTTVAVLTLALGIGANIAVFSVVNTILLRPLPFPDSQRLARIVEKNASSGESSKTYTADATQDFQQQNHSFQSVSGYFAFSPPDNFKLVGNGQPVPATGLLVAEGFFQTLGIEPLQGRLFRSEEFAQHAQPVVMLSHPFWKRQFGGDRSVVGRTIQLNNTSVTVIGILPETFDFGAVFSPGAKVDLFAPYIMDDFRDDGNDLALFGRLRPGVTLAQAQSEADQLFPQLYFEHKHPEYGKPYTAQLTGLKEYISGKLRRSLIVLWCAVGVILLIVCVNLSNLLLARTAARSRRAFARMSSRAELEFAAGFGELRTEANSC